MNFTLSLTVLLTGFAVVFTVLLLLIGIIKLYGTIIYRLQNKNKKKDTVVLKKIERTPQPIPQPVHETDEVDDDELIAVIAAAVYAVCSPSNVRIKSIRKASARSNAWRSAGLSDNLRPF